MAAGRRVSADVELTADALEGPAAGVPGAAGHAGHSADGRLAGAGDTGEGAEAGEGVGAAGFADFAAVETRAADTEELVAGVVAIAAAAGLTRRAARDVVAATAGARKACAACSSSDAARPASHAAAIDFAASGGGACGDADAFVAVAAFAAKCAEFTARKGRIVGRVDRADVRITKWCARVDRGVALGCVEGCRSVDSAINGLGTRAANKESRSEHIGDSVHQAIVP